MSAPTPVPIRRAMWRRFQNGATAVELSAAFGLPARTVRGLLQRWRKRGAAGLVPDRPPPRATAKDHPDYPRAIRMRQEHPGWGAGIIRVYLARHDDEPPPSERTLQRWFQRAGLSPAPPGKRPTVERKWRAGGPHDVWQVDAAEDIPLADGGRACWLRITDEFSGAVLRTVVFPPGALGRRAGLVHPNRAAPRLRPLGPAAGHPRG